MNSLKPWTYGPFELIMHAELHLREGGDFDRRVALIGFDNSVEVSITTYLNLHPIQRGNRQYNNDDITRWLNNYYTKLDFIELEATNRGITLEVPKDEIAWYHKIRNDQYHGGITGVPDDRNLTGIRKAAICIFSILFDVSNMEMILDQAIQKKAVQQGGKPQRDGTLDKLLDMDNEEIIVAGEAYRLSEALFLIDPEAYIAELASLEISRNFIDGLRGKYPDYVRNDLVGLQFIHYSEKVYLKTIDLKGIVSLDDIGFIIEDQRESEMFPATNSADDNATKFIEQLDPYSIINCTDLFSDAACKHIAESHCKVE